MRASHQESVIEHVVDHVGVNFHAGIVDSAVRCRAQVADAGGGGSDQYNLSLECSGAKFSVTTSAIEYIRIASSRAAIVDLHVARIIRLDFQLVAKVEANDSDLVEVH